MSDPFLPCLFKLKFSEEHGGVTLDRSYSTFDILIKLGTYYFMSGVNDLRSSRTRPVLAYVAFLYLFDMYDSV